MKSALATVTAYYEAFGRKDLQQLREVLAPDFSFKGPLMAFDSAEAFVQAISSMPFEATIEGSRFISDGPRVAHAFLWRMTAPAQAEIPMCEVFELAGGKIRSAELYYDARLFPAPNTGAQS
jgi:ketosteroid isomerase-like protein